ncbi:MAG: tyrosine--tRNA ligase [bacterium]|nr:tyrosine--tRNA ligase [bacterium]
MTHNDPIHSLLSRGVAEVIDRKHLEARLKKGEKLRIKYGIDANKPQIHIGHTVPLHKLREFQDAGHTAVLILGDYTAQLGDPSDRSEARKLISHEETKRNADMYLTQVFSILDKKKTEVHRNSEWFSKFTLRDVIELMATTTLNRLLAHETFGERLKKNQPLHAQEILYPLMQGYDSVMIKADVELGGMDQKFNVLMGREVQHSHGMPEQDVILFPYIPGTDGNEKMSKSLGNTINITDVPADMYGKVMSISDKIMWKYFDLATKIPEKEISKMSHDIKAGTLNPRDAKMFLAREITTMYHSKKDSEQAEAQFIQVFQQQKRPDEIPVFKIAKKNISLINALVETKLATSTTDARALIKQKSVKIDDEIVDDIKYSITIPAKGTIIQKGKRYFVKVMG